MDLQYIFTEALQLHMKGRLEQAKEKYRQILEVLPYNVNVLGNIGIVCRDMGRQEEALQYCLMAVDSAPHDPQQLLNLGAVYEDRGEISEARDCYEKALALEPSHPKALNNLGKLLHSQGRVAEALAYLEKAVLVEPDYQLALNNIGVLLSEQGDIEAAALYLEKSHGLDPSNKETLYNLAGLYNCANKMDKAKVVLKKLLALDPEHPSANHMLAAISGFTTENAPQEYIVETFDRYAGRFDEHLQGALGYCVPSILADLVEKVRPQAHFQNCLDLGCGTGLSGKAFRGRCDRLVGVDLSTAMLAKARQKKIYEILECDDVTAFLGKETTRYDLFLATDLFIYFGRLDNLFQEVSRLAVANAIFAFSLERHDGPEKYVLNHSGRYSHSPLYLQAVAEATGFSVLHHSEHDIRKESGIWIPGDLYVLEVNSLFHQ